ncbi:Callose synthase 10 [Vitis vinifera]|uniref:Callose synthase 10 n=1 Tax=Vitis vinifera TaxID=29760 RepID=A0A438CTU3_VITVI|nr:Callose synthase 10 [Vitis vinifera]
MFQALTIIAFNHGNIDLDTFKIILSIGPTFAIMNFAESCLDVLLMFGAYATARGMAISRLVIRFFWCGFSSVFVTYVYLKLLQERKNPNSDSFYFRIYIIVLGVYAALRLVLAMLLKFPSCHALSEMSDQAFFRFFKWIYQERYYVGRGLLKVQVIISGGREGWGMEDKIWGWQVQVQSRAPSTVLDLSSEANRAHKTTENMLKNAKDQNPPKNVGLDFSCWHDSKIKGNFFPMFLIALNLVFSVFDYRRLDH